MTETYDLTDIGLVKEIVEYILISPGCIPFTAETYAGIEESAPMKTREYWLERALVKGWRPGAVPWFRNRNI